MDSEVPYAQGYLVYGMMAAPFVSSVYTNIQTTLGNMYEVVSMDLHYTHTHTPQLKENKTSCIYLHFKIQHLAKSMNKYLAGNIKVTFFFI